MTDNSLSRPNLVLYLSFMYDTNLNRKPPQKKGLISLTKKPSEREGSRGPVQGTVMISFVVVCHVPLAVTL